MAELSVSVGVRARHMWLARTLVWVASRLNSQKVAMWGLHLIRFEYQLDGGRWRELESPELRWERP